MEMKKCSINDCDNASYCLGMCKKHYTRVKRYGSPDGFAPLREPGRSYETAHENVKKAKGQASKYRCVGCGSRASEWSYGHSDPDELFDDKRGLLYSMKPECYRPRCRSCHSAFDRLYQVSRYFSTSNVVPAR